MDGQNLPPPHYEPSPIQSLAGLYESVLLKKMRHIQEKGHAICILDGLANNVLKINPNSESQQPMWDACEKARSSLYWQGFFEHKKPSNSVTYEEIISSNAFQNEYHTHFKSPHPTRDGMIMHTCQGDLLGAIGLSAVKGEGYNDLLELSAILKKETCKPYMQSYISQKTI